MARKQTRRGVSLWIRLHEAATAHAASCGIPLSRMTEDALLFVIGDPALAAEVDAHRSHVEILQAPRPAIPESERPGPVLGPKRRHGRPLGAIGVCSACGEPGHRAAHDGLCSPTFLGARLVLEDGVSLSEASIEAGVSRQTIHRTVAKIRKVTPAQNPTP